MEKRVWKASALNPEGRQWYQETGSGMGQTLNIAAEKGGYALTDRGTYLSLKKQLGLEVLFAGDPALLNIYHVIEVNGARWPKVNSTGAKAFADFLLSPETQNLIASFGVSKYGSPLFFADGGKKENPEP